MKICLVQKENKSLNYFFNINNMLKKTKINKQNVVDGNQMCHSQGTGQDSTYFRVVHAAGDAYTIIIIIVIIINL